MKSVWENKYIFMTEPEEILTVIIPAAGSGARMGNAAKPLIDLCGKKVIEYSLEIFQNSPYVKQIAISASKEIFEEISSLAKKYPKVKKVIYGGDTRQNSVSKAFRAVFEKKENITPYVAIHDAARPLITESMLEGAVKCAVKYGSAVCAARVRDTVRRTDKACFAKEEVDRKDLWAMQTPQIFDTDIYHTSLAFAEKNSYDATDDASLLVYTGFKVKMFECASTNIKLTYPEDLDMAKLIIKSRSPKGEV